jgi:hypothetical protein
MTFFSHLGARLGKESFNLLRLNVDVAIADVELSPAQAGRTNRLRRRAPSCGKVSATFRLLAELHFVFPANCAW